MRYELRLCGVGWQRVKKYLLTGLLVWVPLGITLWVLDLTISTLDQSLLLLPENWHPNKLLGVHIPGLGVILTAVIVIGTGLLTRNVFGQRLLLYWDGLLHRIPFVNAVYKSVKQVSDTLLSSNGQAFRKVLLVRYPHAHSWSLAFQTGEGSPEIRDKTGRDILSVFVPTTPNPTSGFFLMVPREETIELDMSVDEGLKMLLSVGVVVPEGRHKTAGRTPDSRP